MFDLVNEHHCCAQSISDANVSAWDLKGAYLAAAPDRLWHVSSTGDHLIDDFGWTVSATQRANIAFHANTLVQPILTDHLAGSSDAMWFEKVDQWVGGLRTELTALGKTIPIYLDEPPWADAGGVAATNTSAAAWISSIVNAKAAGAAGYVLDALVGVNMVSQSYLTGASAKALTVLDAAGDLVVTTSQRDRSALKEV